MRGASCSLSHGRVELLCSEACCAAPPCFEACCAAPPVNDEVCCAAPPCSEACCAALLAELASARCRTAGGLLPSRLRSGARRAGFSWWLRRRSCGRRRRRRSCGRRWRRSCGRWRGRVSCWLGKRRQRSAGGLLSSMLRSAARRAGFRLWLWCWAACVSKHFGDYDIWACCAAPPVTDEVCCAAPPCLEACCPSTALLRGVLCSTTSY